MTLKPNERYIGDGVYAQLDPGHMIVLRTARGEEFYGGVHWIALEPEVFTELLNFAREIGWGALIVRAANQIAVDDAVSDEEYARDEEDKERKRAAAEGFEILTDREYKDRGGDFD